MRIIETALGYGDFLKTSFWEPVFGLLVLGEPVKWGFLLPKKEQPILPFLGALVFGKMTAVFGKSPISACRSIFLILEVFHEEEEFQRQVRKEGAV